MGHRWVGELADFHFTIRYRQGKSNADAETLSKYPVPLHDHEFLETMPPEVISAIWQGEKAAEKGDVPWLAALQMKPVEDEPPSEGIPVITPVSINAAQKEDAPICEVINLKKRG